MKTYTVYQCETDPYYIRLNFSFDPAVIKRIKRYIMEQDDRYFNDELKCWIIGVEAFEKYRKRIFPARTWKANPDLSPKD